MKYLILLLLSFGSFAAKDIYLPESEIDKALIPPHVNVGLVKCKHRPLEQCMKLPSGVPIESMKKQPQMIDDFTKPKFKKSELESCIDEADCDLKLSSKSCLMESIVAIKNFKDPNWEIYCPDPNGFKKKESGLQELVLDEVKRSAMAQARIDGKAARKAERDNIKAVKQSLNCGGQAGDMKNHCKAIKFLLKNI